MIINFRKAKFEDVHIYYEWATDDIVRENSYQQSKISLDDHIDWFKRKLSSPDCFFYFFSDDQIPVGQVRIENKQDESVIGISIDGKYRGKGLGSLMLNKACDDFFSKFPQKKIVAYIKHTNIQSYRTFIKAKFIMDKEVLFNGINSFKLYKTRSHGV